MSDKYRRIKAHGRRVSLRCPLSIPESMLLFSKAEGKYNIRLSLYNDGNGSSDDDTVESAVIVLRCADKSGEYVRLGENDYFAKTVKFGDQGLARGQSVSMSVTLAIPDQMKITDFELYISRARFVNMAVEDYIRDDFFAMPEKPVEIAARKFTVEQLAEIGERFGDSAIYLPEALTPVVWRCTCGELCEGEQCPTCLNKKDELLAFFAPPAADDQAVLQDPDAEERSKKKKKDKIITAISIPLPIIMLAVAVIIVINVTKSNNKPVVTDRPTEITTTLAPPVTTDPGVSAYNTAMSYVSAHEFDKAIAAAKNGGCGEDVLTYIYTEATKYNVGIKNYTKAYSYARQMSNTAYADELIRSAYNSFIEENNYADALAAADALGDPELASAVAEKAVSDIAQSGDYIAAYTAALSYSIAELADEVYASGISAYLSDNDYENALALAGLRGDGEKELEINKSAAMYYIDRGDLETASSYAAATGDAETITYLCSRLSDKALMRSFPAYSAYLTAGKKRTLLANTVSAGDYAACITSSGKVIYGRGEIFTPSGSMPVSVASSGRHTVILLSDGSVVAFGDNSYGQCQVTGWSNIVMISVGRYHTVALSADGRVYCAGRNNFGQTSVGNINDAVMVSAGEYTTLVLKKDGSVSAFGKNTDGQCSVEGWKNVVYISAGSVHSVGITGDGKAVSAGSDLLGMSALSSWSDLTAISAGGTFTVGKRADGSYIAAGSLIGGSLGSLSVIAGSEYFDAGEGYMIARFADGSVKVTGSLAPDMSIIDSVINPPKP